MILSWCRLQLELNPSPWKRSTTISSPMNSDLSTISLALTSLSLGHTMLPLEEILSATLVAATIISIESYLLDGGFPVEIPTDSHVERCTTLTPFLVVALPLTLFAKFTTVWATSLLITTTATTSPSLETPPLQANLSVPFDGPDLNWYPDFGATHYVTSDMTNLNLKAEEFHDFDQIRIGNGKGLSIHHIGYTRLFSLTLQFDLFNVLHIPKISKILLYVHKFTTDTNTLFEFHSDYFLLKDQCSKKLLLHSPNSHGVYQFPFYNNKPSPSTLLGEHVSLL